VRTEGGEKRGGTKLSSLKGGRPGRRKRGKVLSKILFTTTSIAETQTHSLYSIRKEKEKEKEREIKKTKKEKEARERRKEGYGIEVSTNVNLSWKGCITKWILKRGEREGAITRGRKKRGREGGGEKKRKLRIA